MMKAVNVALTTDDIRRIVEGLCALRREYEQIQGPASMRADAADDVADLLKLGDRLLAVYTEALGVSL